MDHWKKKLHWPMLPALVTTVQCYLWPSGQVFGISGCMVMDILLAVNTVIQCKHSDIKVSSEDMPVKCDDVDDVSCKSRIDAIRAWSFRSMTIVSI